ncbi:Fumarylacetoacetase [Manis pentadactyla]|nr:Fumarylacetoacetase [Manis pentadactyla]
MCKYIFGWLSVMAQEKDVAGRETVPVFLGVKEKAERQKRMLLRNTRYLHSTPQQFKTSAQHGRRTEREVDFFWS